MNGYIDGWSFSCIERLDKTPEIIAEWEVGREQYASQYHVVATQSGGKENKVSQFKLHMQWLDGKHKATFGTFSWFAMVRDFLHLMKRVPDAQEGVHLLVFLAFLCWVGPDLSNIKPKKNNLYTDICSFWLCTYLRNWHRWI